MFFPLFQDTLWIHEEGGITVFENYFLEEDQLFLFI